MLQNEMKKGQYGVLQNCWKFRIEDNKKGNIRLATVWGFETEMGSIYTSDIDHLVMADGSIEQLEMTKAQAKRSDKTAQLMRGLFGS